MSSKEASMLPETGFLRLKQIIGDPGDEEKGRPAILPIIPVKKSAWWKGVQEGIYPKPIKLSRMVTVWRVEDIRAFIESKKEVVNAEQDH